MVRYNRTRPREQPFAADYAEALDSLPTTAYEFEPTSHQFLLAGYFEESLIHVCGSPVQAPRKKHIEPDTVAAVMVKGSIRGSLKYVRAVIDCKPSMVVFLAWKRMFTVNWFNFRTGRTCDTQRRGAFGDSHVSWYPVSGFTSKAISQYAMCLSVMDDAVEARILAAVPRNLRDHDVRAHDSFATALRSNTSAEMHKACAVVKAKPKSRSKRIRDIDGKVAINDRAERLTFRRHFSRSLKGSDATLEHIISVEREAYKERKLHLSLAVESIPTLTDTTRLVATATKQSAVGGDRLGSEAFSAAPKQVAKHLHPLHVKAAILVRPALQWVGGYLFEVWKGSGATDALDRFREVAITVHDGKLFSRFYRNNMIGTVDSLTEDTQFGGGLHGGETAIAHLALKAAADVISQSGRSPVFLFTDIAGAFASLARQIVLPTGQGDEAFLRSLAAAGVDSSVIGPWYQDLKDTSFWIKHGELEHNVQMVTALHRHTWAAVDGAAGCISTTGGAIAGTTCADVIFSVGIGRAIRWNRMCLRREGLTEEFDTADIESRFGHSGTGKINAGKVEIVDTSFVDDVGSVTGADALLAVQVATRMAQIAADVYLLYGMPLNFKRGKSEALIRWHGVNALTAQRKFLVGAPGGVITIKRCPKFGEHFDLHIVHEYKHLGTMTTVAGNADRDICVRTAMMTSSAASFCKRVFAVEEIEIARNVTILTVYLLTKGCYHIGTWQKLSVKTEKRVQSSIMKLYRAAVRAKWDGEGGNNLSDLQVLQVHNLVAPLNLVILARIQLFMRVALKAPDYVLHILAASDAGQSSTWMAAVREDVLSLSSFGHFVPSSLGALVVAQAAGGPLDSLATWATLARSSGSQTRKALVAFIRDPLTNTSLMQGPVRRVVVRAYFFQCSACNDSFPTKQQHAVHMFKEHGIRPRLRPFLTGVTCESCLMTF